MQDQRDLKNAGLNATLPRLKVLSLFENSKERHLSAEDIYKVMLNAGEDVGLATVYRVLTQFEQAGLLVRHHFESGKAVFELNSGGHHDHVVCVKCGRVEEFYDAEIEKRQEVLVLILKDIASEYPQVRDEIMRRLSSISKENEVITVVHDV